jgi:outer membrane protein
MNRIMLILALIAGTLPGTGVRTAAQPARSLRIAIVADGPWERNESIRDLLQKGIREVVGKDAPVTFPHEKLLVGDWTLSGVRALDDRLLADPDVDMVLGMGLIASQDLATRGPLPKPVIAPVVIDVDRQHIPMRNGTSGVKNLNYLVYPTTFVRDLQIYRDIIPIRKLVNISSKPYEDVLPVPAVSLVELGRRLGVEVTECFIGYSADEVLGRIPADADAVFLEPMLHLPPAEFKKLVRGFIARRLPSFSFFGEEQVRQGIMASANPDIIPRLVRRIAMNVQRILSGEEPGSLAVAFTPGKRLTINMSTAYAVGVSPKWNTLLEAELVQIDTAVPGGISLTLAEAIRRSSEQNLEVQAKNRQVSAESNNIGIARASLLPSLDVGSTGLQIDPDRAQAGAQPERSGSLDFSASQVILSEPAMANVSIQSSLQDSREQDLAITRLNTIVDGSSAYLNYLRARKIFYLLLDNLKLTRTNLELARVRQTTGAAGPEETLRWEVEIASLRKTAMDVQSQMNQALYALKQVLNIPLLYVVNVAEVSLDDPAMFISGGQLLGYLEDPLSFELLTDFLASEGVRLSPEMRQIDAVISAQERALTSARLSYILPTIAAFGRYSDRFYKSEIVSPFQLPPVTSAPPAGTPAEAFIYQILGSLSPKLPGDRSWSFGVQLSLNLFNGFATKASEDRTSMILEQYRLQRASAETRVALRIRVEMEKAKASYFSIQQARLEQDAARKTLDIVTDSYSRGAVSILSLLDAQNSALRADQVAANALYDFFTDYISLERAIGEIDVLMTPPERQDLLERLGKHMAAAGKR